MCYVLIQLKLYFMVSASQSSVEENGSQCKLLSVVIMKC
jgi:hypothetical protein